MFSVHCANHPTKLRNKLFSIFILTLVVAHLSAQSAIYESGGKVGVGTPTPNTKLHVFLNSGGPVARFESAVNNNGQSYVYNNTANTISIWGVYDYAGSRFSYVGTESPHPFSFITSNVERMRITDSGNVGIGTTSPTSFGTGATLTEIHGTTSYGALLTSTNNVTGEIFASEGGEVYIGSRSAHPLQLAAGNIPRMTISTSGNVGIGTTDPAVPLEIFKGGNDIRAIKISMMPTTPGTHYSELQFGVRGDLTAKGAGVRGYFTNFTGTYASELRFFTSDVNNTSTENFVIKGDTGNVGIGTTNPTQKLSVNGTIRAKEVVVETSGWSDYVFADDYVLQPLAEVEAQIKQDRHLPGIPSAQQVAESGVGLGEMQAKLLAKIEELTLHQIEQEKRLVTQAEHAAAQDRRIQSLEDENRKLKTARN